MPKISSDLLPRFPFLPVPPALGAFGAGDLLITDLFSDNLPLQTKYFGMNGLELLSKLAEDCVSFPILVFSGSLSNYEITLKAKQCAGEHLKLSFFRKPCTQEQLVSELLTLI